MSDTVRIKLNQTLEDLRGRLDRLLDELDESGGPDIELESSDGKLVITLEDGVKLIINRQSGNDQIWLAEPEHGWHFEWTGEEWRCDVRGLELFAALSALLTERVGLPITL